MLRVLVRTTEGALQLHVVSAGIPAQLADESGIVPVYPAAAAKVILAWALPPGLLIVTVAWRGVAVKVGAPVTTSAVVA